MHFYEYEMGFMMMSLEGWKSSTILCKCNMVIYFSLINNHSITFSTKRIPKCRSNIDDKSPRMGHVFTRLASVKKNKAFVTIKLKTTLLYTIANSCKYHVMWCDVTWQLHCIFGVYCMSTTHRSLSRFVTESQPPFYVGIHRWTVNLNMISAFSVKVVDSIT